MCGYVFKFTACKNSPHAQTPVHTHTLTYLGVVATVADVVRNHGPAHADGSREAEGCDGVKGETQDGESSSGKTNCVEHVGPKHTHKYTHARTHDDTSE